MLLQYLPERGTLGIDESLQCLYVFAAPRHCQFHCSQLSPQESNPLRYLVIISGELLSFLLGHRLAIIIFASRTQSQEVSLIAFEATSNFISLARNKEIDSVVLIGQFIEEQILELRQRCIYMPRNHNGLTLIFRGVDLDQVLEFVIIDIV